MRLASVSDLRTAAQQRLPRFLFNYFDGGALSERTMRDNIDRLANIRLQQRVMCDVSTVDMGVALFSRPLSMPVALGPVGLAGLAARRGEVQAARAAQAHGIPFCLSTVSACPIEEVAQSTQVPFWFQLYMIRDRVFMTELLTRARMARCDALVFTVDMPLPGPRYRDVRSGLTRMNGLGGALNRLGQIIARPRWAFDVGVRGRPHQLGNVAPVLKGDSGLEDFISWMRDNFDPSVTWRDLDWVRAGWDGPLIVKGIMTAADADQAISLGADAIVVSNHGGRQLDGVPATATVLERIAEAVCGRAKLLVDGGVRSGLDVFRMLALGADAVLLGRAWAYALAARGGDGVTQMLANIQQELAVSMALTGATTIAQIDRNRLCNDTGLPLDLPHQ